MSIDKIPAFLLAFKVVLSAATTEHSGIQVGLLVKSLKDVAENTQDMFYTGFRALPKHFGIFK